MNDLLSAIYAKFLPGTALHDSLSGRLYFGRAPGGTAEPYGVYIITTGTPEDTFTADVEEVGIQFSFYSENMAETNDLVKECRQLYHGERLSTGYVMRRVLTVQARRSGEKEEDGYQADIEFFIKHEV